MTNMKIGDKVHVYFKKYGEVVNEFDGIIVTDLSYLGDGRRKIWGVERGIKKLADWNGNGSVAYGEEDLKLIESTE